MRYRVIHPFFDATDDLREYRAGDEYPRPGLVPGTDRIARLAGEENGHGVPLIEPVKPVKPDPKRKVKRNA